MRVTTNVTKVIQSARHPIGRFIDTAFWRVSGAIEAALEDLADAEVYAPTGFISNQLIGSAVDHLVRIKLGSFNFDGSAARRGLVVSFRQGPRDLKRVCKSFLASYNDVLQQSLEDEGKMAALAVALAYWESIYRNPQILFDMTFTSLEGLFDRPNGGTKEVSVLAHRALSALGPIGSAHTVGNPVFGHKIIGGDGDLIVADCLIEMKVTPSPIKKKEFKRWMRQLLLYVLLDGDDKHGISTIGVLLPSQQRFLKWKIDDLRISSIGLESLRGVFPVIEVAYASDILGWSKEEAQTALRVSDGTAADALDALISDWTSSLNDLTEFEN